MYQLKTPGALFAVEGIDAAGSSTLVSGLVRLMNQNGLPASETKEPTNGMIGGLIRGILTHDWTGVDPNTTQLLFSADRSHHLHKTIQPLLEKGRHVVTDRYYWSTLAFGWVDVDLPDLRAYNNRFPLPDILFLVDAEIEATQERLAKRDSLELFEPKDTQAIVRENYLRLYLMYEKDFPIVLLDGRLSENELAELAFKAVLNHPLIATGQRQLIPSREFPVAPEYHARRPKEE